MPLAHGLESPAKVSISMLEALFSTLTSHMPERRGLDQWILSVLTDRLERRSVSIIIDRLQTIQVK